MPRYLPELSTASPITERPYGPFSRRFERGGISTLNGNVSRMRRTIAEGLQPIFASQPLSSVTLLTPMRLHTSLFLLFAIVVSAFAQNSKPVADRLSAQNALFEEQYEADLRNSPERATSFGD